MFGLWFSCCFLLVDLLGVICYLWRLDWLLNGFDCGGIWHLCWLFETCFNYLLLSDLF